MPKYIDLDALWRDVTSNIDDCGDVLEIIERQPTVSIDHIAEVGKKVSSSCGHEDGLIDREQAIDALAEMMPKSYTPDGPHLADEGIFMAQEIYADCIRTLKELPSAQPEKRTGNTRKTHVCDLIDRQALCEYALNQKDKSVTPNDIMRFPSAQPEPNCSENPNNSDCISRQAAIDKAYQLGYEDGKRDAQSDFDMTEKIDKAYDDGYEQGYLQGKADYERKTGKWIEVHGFCTPGGDPVWACSECGKGVHVYGIEHGTYGADVSDGQWKACPNCGCRMEGEVHD